MINGAGTMDTQAMKIYTQATRKRSNNNLQASN